MRKETRIKNFRSLGGTYDNNIVIRDIIFRGQKLNKIDDEDIAFLKEKCGIETVIDLRSSMEKNEKPDIVFCKYLFMPIFDFSMPGITHEKMSKSDMLRALPHMSETYKIMLQKEFFENLKAVVRYIVTSREKIYIHCTEGKDRTGVISAIILLMLGVSKEEIYRDYLLTNETNTRKAYLLYFAILFGKFNINDARKARDLYLAKPEYLDVLFDFIDTNYESLDDFFYKGLELTEEEVDGFRQFMIE